MAAIARGADRERPAATPTGLESQRGVHVVGATTPDWTAPRNRATKRRSARSVAASRRSRGPGGINSRSSPLVAADSLLHRPPSAGRSAAGGGHHRSRHPRRRPPAGPSTTAEPHGIRRLDASDSGRHSSRFTRFYASTDNRRAPADAGVGPVPRGRARGSAVYCGTASCRSWCCWASRCQPRRR